MNEAFALRCHAKTLRAAGQVDGMTLDVERGADRIEQLERATDLAIEQMNALTSENEALERSNKELREALQKAVSVMEAEQRIIPSVRFAEVLPVARAALSADAKGEKG